MKLNLRAIILIIIGILIIAVGIRAVINTGSLSADIGTQQNILEDYTNK